MALRVRCVSLNLNLKKVVDARCTVIKPVLMSFSGVPCRLHCCLVEGSAQDAPGRADVQLCWSFRDPGQLVSNLFPELVDRVLGLECITFEPTAWWCFPLLTTDYQVKLCSDQAVVSPTVGSTHGPDNTHFLLVRLADYDIIQEMPLFRARVLPGCFVFSSSVVDAQSRG